MLGTIVIKVGLAGILVWGLMFVLLAERSMAQVVIVPSRQVASAARLKTKSQSRKRSRLVPEQFKEQIAEITSPVGPPSTIPSLSFVIIPSVAKKTDTVAAVNSKVWPELLGYEFDVIKVDDKGKLHGDNTDYYGFSYMAEKAGISFKNKKGKQQEKQAPKNSHTFINLHKYQSTL